MDAEMTMLEKIYVKYKDLRDEAKKDCAFSKVEFESNFAVTPLLIKWINKKSEWANVNRNFELKRKEAYVKSFAFYQTGFPLKLTTKDEYAMHIESSTEYVEAMNYAVVTKEILQFIDSTIETLKSKSWEIKTYLEWLKFKNGQ